MKYTETLNILTKTLEKSSKVNSYDSANEKESVRMTHAIIDMSESCKEISENLFPKLLSNNITEEDVEDILLDIGEELRHIVYHIKDTKFYEYIAMTI